MLSQAAVHAARPFRWDWAYAAVRCSAASVRAARAMGAPGAVVVRAIVQCLAAKGATVVDEFLVFFDHVDGLV